MLLLHCELGNIYVKGDFVSFAENRLLIFCLMGMRKENLLQHVCWIQYLRYTGYHNHYLIINWYFILSFFLLFTHQFISFILNCICSQSFYDHYFFHYHFNDLKLTTFVLQCPIDTRKQLAENIVLVGGTVMTPGFK